MEDRTLPVDGWRPPAAGFGCSSLMATLTRSQSLVVLAAAKDAGVTHFDVARSYGYGQAESVLGEFSSRCRDTITITSKFGIEPPSRHLSRGPLMTVARGLARTIPWLRPMMRRRAAGLVRPGVFDVSSAILSLETSLRELRTDYIDVYLLHECDLVAAQDDGLFKFLSRSVQSGKILRYGVSASCDVVSELVVSPSRDRIAVIQTSDVLKHSDCLAISGRNKTLFLHSALSRTLSLLASSRLSESETKVWSSKVGVNLSSPENVASLTFASARARYPDSCTLFTSRNPRRTMLSAEAILRKKPEKEQIRAFDAFVGALDRSSGSFEAARA